MSPAAEAVGRRRPTAPAIVGFALVYALLGAASFSTAYVASNAATVWMPAGFSIGLLVARGRAMWPCVTLGSFVLNGLGNLFAGLPLATSLAVAAAIAAGSTGEAVSGAYLTRRFAGGTALLGAPRNMAAFAGLVAPLPPLISMAIGVAASHAGGVPRSGSMPDLAVTWYFANAVGILILMPPVLALLTPGRHGPPVERPRVERPRLERPIEACALAAALLFVGQAMSGRFLVPSLGEWPLNYLLIPLLLWATFRFGTAGALLAILTVAAVSIIGTVHGFEAFPASSPSLSLLFLQLFLGLLSVTALTISAALTRIADLQFGLQREIGARTQEVERLVRARQLITGLVVHDLQSPLYGIRNALRAAAASLRTGGLDAETTAAAMDVMDETCTALAGRVAELLAPGEASAVPPPAVLAAPRGLASIVSRILATHRLSGFVGPVTLRFESPDLAVRHPAEVERILDGLVANAFKHGPAGEPIEICAFTHGGTVEILVADRGPGVRADLLPLLFRPDMQCVDAPHLDGSSRSGLYLASEQASALGGRLSYVAGSQATTFRLLVPA